MLQAREFACILLLVASVVLERGLYAQNTESSGSERQIQRLGDDPIDHELQLDLTVPTQEKKPSDAQDAASEPVDPAAARAQAITNHLAAARTALKEGRIDHPPRDCAWSHYRAVLDIDPENVTAQHGLQKVQEAMVSRALDLAREFDFESAERVLEDAALVREGQEPIEQAREEISKFRAQQVETLEVKAVRAMDGGNFAEAERVLIDLIALGGADTTVSQLRRRLEEARIYGGFGPGQIIRDHFINEGFWTPESVVVLAGSFMMGSSAFEEGRTDNEGPRHRVTFRRGFAIGRTEVTVKQFRLFVDRTRHKTDADKQGYSTVYNHSSGRLTKREGITWQHNYEGRDAQDDEPVVHVSWNDAMAYVQWLARGTGKPYRLLTESEFEYALRGGKSTRYWWGEEAPRSIVENLTGEKDSSRSHRQWTNYFEAYGDGFWGPAPAASFKANPFGLHDIGGNVGEWVRDCWHDTYIRAPVDGSAWVNPGCRLRVIRGGYWASSPEQSRSAFRLSAQPDRRDARIGFRIARDL
jgi:formylglycine-generating enzyme required for sulfatase activity